jgi:phosphohistidine phosphatase
MKTVILVRHAKSSWDSDALSDFERPLNDRGRKDAPDMAQRLLSRKVGIDAFISSPAKRARKTAQLFVKEYNVPEESILYRSELYHVQKRLKSLTSSPAEYRNVAFPLTIPAAAFANSLTENMELDNIPTCGVFAIKIILEVAGVQSG